MPLDQVPTPPGRATARSPLMDRNRLYRLLVERVQGYAIFALDPAGHIVSWNPGAERLKGYREEEVLGQHFSTFYAPADVAAGRPARLLAEAEREGQVEDAGWRIRKDGSRFWASVMITALRDDDGGLVGFAKITRDLTEQRRAEDSLRESEERFRLLVQSVKDYAIFMLDPKGYIQSWNEGAERIKGYTAEEVIGRHFSAFYPAAEVSSGKPRRELEIAATLGQYEEEGWRLRKDGTCFWASVLISALRDDDGRLVGFAKITRDLTERRAAQERELADARRIAEVEAASRTKSEFLAAMSHELRTPINATLGYTDLLEMGISGELTRQQRDYLSRIRGSQQHLLRIITDLLNYSRLEAGQLDYEFSVVPLHEVVDAVAPMVEPQALARGLTVIREGCPPEVVARADRARAEQIVLNLLSNAVKFTPAGGLVTVGCGVAGGRACIRVSDTGPGIPADQQSSIFQPFVQLGRTLTSGHEGTGLGLAISLDLARAMGGDLSVRSEADRGTTFTLALPIPDEAEPAG